jgi:Asp-tRNA(Asn)/Glu-tRNA(Gln) amidotransferase A subunit family amidase
VDAAGPLWSWPATRLAAGIAAGEVSATEAVQACLQRIDELEPAVNAFITLLPDAALAAAKVADDRHAKGEALPPLHGVPFAIKDAFTYPGTRTTVSSKHLMDYAPDLPTAASVANLEAAGAILIGKNNVGSGMAPPKLVPPRTPPTKNPWKADRTAGGSSSGSAACVAVGMVSGSVGTDLGGSIRNPASFCGVVGLKPTHGMVPLDGNIFGLGTRAEHVGPLARSAADAALFLGGLAGQGQAFTLDDSFDASTVRVAAFDGGGLEPAAPDVWREIEGAYAALSDAGFPLRNVDMPSQEEAHWLFVTLFDEWEEFETRNATTDQYLAYIAERLRLRRGRAQQSIDRWTAQLNAAYDELFESHDVLALGTAPITARQFDATTMEWRGEEIATNDLHSVNTWAFNLTGHPVVSVPCGFDDEGLPVGIQLVGRRNGEQALLGVAQRYEQVRGPFPFPSPSVG